MGSDVEGTAIHASEASSGSTCCSAVRPTLPVVGHENFLNNLCLNRRSWPDDTPADYTGPSPFLPEKSTPGAAHMQEIHVRLHRHRKRRRTRRLYH